MPHQPFIYIPDSADDDTLTVGGSEANHLHSVLRAKIGFEFTAFNGQGKGWLARVVSSTKKLVTAIIISELPEEPPPLISVTAAVGIVKGSRMDWAIEKAAELGVTRFIPMISRYGVIEPRSNKIERWRGLALAAAKQSRRLRLMKIEAVTPLKTIISLNTGSEIIALDNTTGCVQLHSYLRKPDNICAKVLLIGPEGGFSEEEIELMDSENILRVSMGSHAYRTETASVVSAGIVMNCLVASEDASSGS